SEMRLSANLLLCYGGSGVHYFWFDNFFNTLAQTHPGSVTHYEAAQCCAGPTGEFGEHDSNVVSVVFRVNSTPGITYVVPNVYTGYKNRSAEMQWIDTLLYPLVGNEMLKRKLRWRTSYSMNFQVLRPDNS